jgi:5-methylcytosine-specific restriction endonuclease McrA
MNAPEYARLDVTCPHCKRPFRVPISTARATLIPPAAPALPAGARRAKRTKFKPCVGGGPHRWRAAKYATLCMVCGQTKYE